MRGVCETHFGAVFLPMDVEKREGAITTTRIPATERRGEEISSWCSWTSLRVQTPPPPRSFSGTYHTWTNP